MTTQTKKAKAPVQVSPVGTAAYAWLTQPDTGKEYSDDKYKITLLLDKDGDNADEIEKFIAGINKAHAAKRGKKKTESPVKDGDELTNREGEAKFPGKWAITMKSSFQPQVIVREEGQVVMSGDLVKCAFSLNEYEKGPNAGVSLRLAAVKLIKKINKGRDFSDVFGDDDDDYEDSNDNAEGSAGSDESEDF